MSLVKSPMLTAAKLAANARNAVQSTGPRTPAGKRRIVLNALKHGRFSPAFRDTLVKARADAELFDWIRARVFDCFEPHDARHRRQAERLARAVWCQAWQQVRTIRRVVRSFEPGVPRPRAFRPPSHASLWCLAWTPQRRGGLETKPRYSLLSTDSSITCRFRIRIVHAQNGRRLAFWVRRRRGTAPPRRPVIPFEVIAAWVHRQEAAQAAAGQAAAGQGG